MVLVYKAGGKNPLCIDSYWGITLTSMVAKVLDFCYLIGLSQSSSMQVCHTSISQHTDREAHDCADAINLNHTGGYFQVLVCEGWKQGVCAYMICRRLLIR